jgi:hypothetical protein
MSSLDQGVDDLWIGRMRARVRQVRAMHRRPISVLQSPHPIPPEPPEPLVPRHSADPVALAQLRHREQLSESGLGLEQGASGDFAEVSVAPECDDEYSGQGDDADLAEAGSTPGEAAVEPESQLAFGLEAQPDPGQVDGDAADVAVASSADTAFSGRIAALVWGRGQAHERTDLPAVLESSPRELSSIGLGADLGDAAQSHQTPGNFRGTVLTLPDPSIPLTLELQKLAMDDTVTSDLRCARR